MQVNAELVHPESLRTATEEVTYYDSIIRDIRVAVLF
jgi:hypothetical protein